MARRVVALTKPAGGLVWQETAGALIGVTLVGPATFGLAQANPLGIGWAFAAAMLLATIAAGLGAAIGSRLARSRQTQTAPQTFEVELAQGMAHRIARVVAPSADVAAFYASRLSPGALVQVRPVSAALGPRHSAVRLSPWIIRD
jgi:hypothetical protein